MPEKGNVAEWVETMLAEGVSGRRWPKDEELQDYLLRYRAYSNPIDRCKFILETLEEFNGHKEPASYEKATIEHIMPQTLSPEWRAELGERADAVRERWLDLLGNLTLSGYNSELYNYPFSVKRELLSESHFVMNEWISAQQQWGEAEMNARTTLLFESAKKIWARP